ncbi:MAG: hypothetical protein GXP31_10170 [Kiritimatiellaeota bacterium]|nr:hypothetical protein [Kiritimatiellota bacterium]
MAVNAAAPGVVSIRDRRTGERFPGTLLLPETEIEICDLRNGRRYLQVPGGGATLSWTFVPGPGRADYHGEVRVGARLAVTLRLTLRLEKNALVAQFDDVHEEPGFEFMQIRLPELCAVTAAHRGHLAIPTEAGRDIPAAEAGTGEYEVKLDWFDTLQAAVLWRESGKSAILCRSLGYEDGILARVMPPCAEAGRYAALGARLVHRLRAFPPAAQFVAQPSSGIRLSLVRDVDGDGTADWVDAAKTIRETFTCRPNPLYCSATTYKIMCDVRPHRLVTTFGQALDLIRRVHNLTDGMNQVVYLVGWQHDGHDTGYPDVSVVNPRLGGYDALRHLMLEARKLGAIVSFHDNYDDAYKDSPKWDPDVVARNNRGELWKGGVWAGSQSYILSAPKYMQKGGRDRIRYTVQHYGIKQTTHIDVLSAVPQRHDLDPRAPAGIRESLEGKFAIIREFNRLGVDVTSEGVTEPFIGPMTRFRHLMRRDRQVFPGERRIPFVPFAIHGRVVYGGGQAGFGELLGGFIYGQTYSADFNKATPEALMLDLIYLLDVPMRALATREMQRYERAEDLERVIYGKDTFVEVDWARNSYRIVFEGRTIARNWTTLIETKPGVMLVYSKDGGRIACPFPGAPAALEVRPLTEDGPGAPVPYEYAEGLVHFTAAPHRPYRLAAPVR